MNPDEELPFISTGTGNKSADSPEKRQAINTCLARGVHHLFPQVRTVINLGAETSAVLKLDAQGRLLAWENQDKCASGSGIFLQQMARLMGISLQDMSELSLSSKLPAEISNTCAVFAESEVISHVHRVPPTPMPDIASGIYASMVGRIMAMCKRIGVEKEVAAVGGVAQAKGLVHLLEDALGFEILIPDNPQTVAALGAALIARDNIMEGFPIK